LRQGGRTLQQPHQADVHKAIEPLSNLFVKMYQTRQAYAPTPHSYVPNTALSATINLDEVQVLLQPLDNSNLNLQEVKLAETRAERDLQDSLAEVFSIIITLDELEKAYLKDAISEADYTEICDRLLKQYKAILTDEAVSREFVDLETFKIEWDVGHILVCGEKELYLNWSSQHSYRAVHQHGSNEQQWHQRHPNSGSDTRLYYLPRRPQARAFC
jgi:hypothetical protein